MIFQLFAFSHYLTTKVDFIQHYSNNSLPTYEIKIFHEKLHPISNISSNQISHIYHFDERIQLPATLITNPVGRLTIIIPVVEFKGIVLNFTVDNRDYSIVPYLSLVDKIQSSNYFNSTLQGTVRNLFSPLLTMSYHNIYKRDALHPYISKGNLAHINRGSLHDNVSGNTIHVKRDTVDILGTVGMNVRRAFTVLFKLLTTLGVFVLNFFQGIMSLRHWDLVLSTQKLINKYHNGTVPIMIKGSQFMRKKFHNLVNDWRTNSSAQFLNNIGNNRHTNKDQLNVTSLWESRDIASMTLEDLTIHHIQNATVSSDALSLMKDHASLLETISHRLFSLATPDIVLKMKELKMTPGASIFDSAIVGILKSAYNLFDIALQLLASASNVVFDIVEPIINFMQKLISIELRIPGLESFFKSITHLPLNVMNLLTLNTAMFMNWNLRIFTGKPNLISINEMDILTNDPDPMRWIMNYYNNPMTGPYTKEKELKLGQLLDWMPRCQMMHFQYVAIFFGDMQILLDKRISSTILNSFNLLDLLVFAMNYMYLVPYYPVDFVTNENQIQTKLENPDKYWFTWYLHWFIEVIAGQIHSVQRLFKHSASALGINAFKGALYDQNRFMIKSIIIGLPQLVVISWISNNVWKHCDFNDADRLAITVVNTMAWATDTASYLWMTVLAFPELQNKVELATKFNIWVLTSYIDLTMLGLYHTRLGLMMRSGKYGLID